MMTRPPLSPTEAAFTLFRRRYNSFVAERLKNLLEEKHLYQKESIDPFELLKQLSEEKVIEGVVLTPAFIEELKSKIKAFAYKGHQASDSPLVDAAEQILPCLMTGNIKTYCRKCKRREPFKPIFYSEPTSEIIKKFEQHKQLQVDTFKLSFNRAVFQLFVLVFQCQGCQGTPEAFLIQRAGPILYLHGRSPIEMVETPSFLPEKEADWYSDAIVAFNSRKILAGLFYLRTFIEQFARRLTGTLNEKKTGVEIMEAYAETIPLKHRDTMPSLLEWYEKLSAALHCAEENEALFDEARSEIEEHFDFRRLYKLENNALERKGLTDGLQVGSKPERA